MTDAADLLAPARIAALVAPAVDRLRLAIHRLSQDVMAGLVRELGLDRPMVMVAGNLRNLSPDRVVPRSAVLAVFAYQPSSVVDHGIDGAIGAGLADEAAGQLSLTERGRALAADLLAEGDAVARELWSGQEERVAMLGGLAGRAVRAAASDGGDAFTVMAPVQEPAGASDAALLAERLTGLRFHRFDAHVAAWRAAGLTADQIKALPPGAERAAIEADTNRRAATPYAALEASERLDFLAGLAALPG